MSITRGSRTLLAAVSCTVAALPLIGFAPAADATVTSHNPFGRLDSVTVLSGHRVHLRGWAIDPDRRSQPLQIAVYHGVHGIGWFPSGMYRPDVARAFHAGPRQGFDITVTQLPGKHHMCAYAINIGPGSNTLIGCQTIVVP